MPANPRAMRWVSLALVSMTLAAAPTGAASAAPSPAVPAGATGGIGLQLLDAPAAARDDPRARLYIVDHLAPGKVIHRRVEVTNTTAAPARIRLYAAGASIVAGAFTGADGHTANDVSTWTSIVPAAADIPAGGRLTATVTIAVPRDAAPGEQYGVVWAEHGSAPPVEGGVAQVSRVGIRLYLSVGPGGPPAAAFTIGTVTAQRSADGQPVILATVRNTGGRALDMNGTLRLLGGPGGLSAGPFPANLGVTLAVGDEKPVTIILDRLLPAGPWNAQITLASGLLDETAEATVTFPDAGTAPAVPSRRARPGWIYPAAIAGAMVLLLGALAGAVQVRRLRRRRAAPEHRPEPTYAGSSTP